MPNLGGVNVIFGVDLTALAKGTKEVTSILDGVTKRIANANLGGVIKGDPFSGVNAAIKESQNVLKGYTNSWMGVVNNAEKYISRYTKMSISNMQKVGNALNELILKQENLTKIGSTRSIGDFKKQNIDYTQLSRSPENSLGASMKEGVQKTIETLKTQYPKASKIIDNFLKKTDEGTKLTNDQIEKEFTTLYKSLSGNAKYTQHQIDAFGETLRKSASRQANIEYFGKLSSAKNEEDAIKRKVQAL